MTPRRAKRRRSKINRKRFVNMLVDHQMLTTTIPPFVVNLVNNQALFIRQKLGTISGIKKLVDNTFTQYMYKGTDLQSDPNRIGIKTGLFELTPEFLSYDELKNNAVYNTVQNDYFLGYEVAYAKDKNGTLHPVFEVEDEFKNAVQKPYFYFKVNSQPTYWETNQFDEMELRVYIFICTTRCYIPCFNNGIHAAHMWLTTVILDKNNNGITNVFDTNSTNIYNMQYARGIEILAKIPVITPARSASSTGGCTAQSAASTGGCTLKLHYLSCQNEYYSDANPNTEPCIGLQNREVWGFCQTFALLMYLVILHNPILAKEDLDEVIRRPGLDRLMYTLGGIMGFGKLMAELSDRKVTPVSVR
jgi:hypothetical protein